MFDVVQVREKQLRELGNKNGKNLIGFFYFLLFNFKAIEKFHFNFYSKSKGFFVNYVTL